MFSSHVTVILSFFVVVLLAGQVQQSAAQVRPSPFAGAVPRVQVESSRGSTVCRIPGLKLPDNATVLAAGAYGGRRLNRQIDQSGHEATQIDVTVNSKNPVALVLGAYEPTIWNIGWTEKTKIVAVLVSGYHRQAIAGISQETPTLISTYDNKGPCGYFYVSSEQMPQINSVAQKVFGKTVDTAYAANQGAVLVGSPLTANEKVVSSDWKKVESYFDSNAPLAGKPGLEDAVKKGIIRPASEADFDLLTNDIEKEQGKTRNPSPETKFKSIGRPFSVEGFG